MSLEEQLAVAQQVLGEISYEIGAALDTDESTKFEKSIEYNNKEYTIQMEREDYLESVLIDINKRLEKINYGDLKRGD